MRAGSRFGSVKHCFSADSAGEPSIAVGGAQHCETLMLSSTRAPCCLLLEDEPLVAMALEASVEEAGFQVAGPFMRNATALGWLDGHTPDLALVDVLLRDGPCTPVIRALKARGIPFAVYSGLKPSNRNPELAAVRWLEKPVARHELLNVLREITPKPGGRAGLAPT
jgi:DNA-binding response OmpR family regulator